MLWTSSALKTPNPSRKNGAKKSKNPAEAGFQFEVVRARGLEPPWGYPHTDLNRTRLPIPPRPRDFAACFLRSELLYYSSFGSNASKNWLLFRKVWPIAVCWVYFCLIRFAHPIQRASKGAPLPFDLTTSALVSPDHPPVQVRPFFVCVCAETLLSPVFSVQFPSYEQFTL